MPRPHTAEYQFRLMTLREWKRKTKIEDAVNKIKTKFGKNFATPANVQKWYTQFDNGETSVFEKDFGLYTFSTNQEKEKMTTPLITSLLSLTDDNKFGFNEFSKKGNFLTFLHYRFDTNETFISFYDILNGTEKLIPTPFDFEETTSRIFGNYLFNIEIGHDDRLIKFFVIKLDYNDLSVKVLRQFDVDFNWFYSEMLLDQLDSQRFLLLDTSKIMIGQIYDNDEIVTTELKNIRGFKRLNGIRLIGNKIQGFKNYYNHDTLQFYELNLETIKIKETPVPIKLENDDLECRNCYADEHCWSDDRFYGAYRAKIYETEDICQSQLLMFDSKTLKWSNVNLLGQWPMAMFVDENEVLTLYHTDLRSLYRAPLKKPETLTNLTLLTALREANLYKYDKYIKVAKQYQFQIEF